LDAGGGRRCLLEAVLGRRDRAVEEAGAGAEGDGEDQEVVAVDQARREEGLGEDDAAVDLELAAGLALQLGDRLDRVALDQGGAGP
jgi:hypothetical protein